MSEGGATKIPKIEIEQKVDDSDISSKNIELSGTNILLISKNKNKHEIPIEACEFSKLLKTMLSDNDSGSESDSDNDSEEEEIHKIPLHNISDKILSKITKFLEHLINNPFPEIPKPINSANLIEVLGEDNSWYVDFVNSEDIETIFELVNAANYLDCKSLLNIACVAIASKIKDKSPDEIRNEFGIVNDFSQEEQQKIREENEWVNNNCQK